MSALPEPYYDHAGITIYHSDCRTILPLLAPGSVDLVLTDPPYGINGGRGGDRAFGKALYHAGFSDTPEYIEAVCVAVIKECILKFGRVILTPGIACLWLYPPPHGMGCFWLPAAATHGPWGFTSMSPILYYGKDPRAGVAARPSGIQVTEAAEKNGHPCPKPLKAWRWLLSKGSIDGLILDPFMGSGTTLVAAKQLGRKAIGIEIEERYCEIAVKRLAQEVLPLEQADPASQPEAQRELLIEASAPVGPANAGQ